MRHIDHYSNPRIEAYAAALLDQNNGGVCKHCGSALGHYASCPLLNRESAEVVSAVLSQEALKYTEADKIIAHGMGVIL